MKEDYDDKLNRYKERKMRATTKEEVHQMIKDTFVNSEGIHNAIIDYDDHLYSNYQDYSVSILVEEE